MRLESRISKIEQEIRGYNLSVLNTYDDYKSASYKALISRLRNSIERHKEAIKFIEMYPYGEFVWKDLCSKFKIREYKLER